MSKEIERILNRGDLELDTQGIWKSTGSEDISYPPDGNESCFAVEDQSFWFHHRNRCIVAAIRNFPPAQQAGAIFDIGGGNGFVSKGMQEAGFETVLVEPGPVGALNGKKRGIAHVVNATTDVAKFPGHCMPAVGLFDVIEHIEDDSGFLAHIKELLVRGGIVYATVPAYQLLWSDEDVHAGHFRRYSAASITSVFEAAGFKILFLTHFFRFLLLPIFLLRALPFKLGISRSAGEQSNVERDHSSNNLFVSGMLKRILEPEVANISNRKCMRFGGSILIVARVKDGL